MTGGLSHRRNRGSLALASTERPLHGLVQPPLAVKRPLNRIAGLSLGGGSSTENQIDNTDPARHFSLRKVACGFGICRSV